LAVVFNDLEAALRQLYLVVDTFFELLAFDTVVLFDPPNMDLLGLGRTHVQVLVLFLILAKDELV
jgi:hypothetical protein